MEMSHEESPNHIPSKGGNTRRLFSSYLTKVAHGSAPFIATFLLIHLTAPTMANVGGSDLSSQVMVCTVVGRSPDVKSSSPIDPRKGILPDFLWPDFPGCHPDLRSYSLGPSKSPDFPSTCTQNKESIYSRGLFGYAVLPPSPLPRTSGLPCRTVAANSPVWTIGT